MVHVLVGCCVSFGISQSTCICGTLIRTPKVIKKNKIKNSGKLFKTYTISQNVKRQFWVVTPNKNVYSLNSWWCGTRGCHLRGIFMVLSPHHKWSLPHWSLSNSLSENSYLANGEEWMARKVSIQSSRARK